MFSSVFGMISYIKIPNNPQETQIVQPKLPSIGETGSTSVNVNYYEDKSVSNSTTTTDTFVAKEASTQLDPLQIAMNKVELLFQGYYSHKKHQVQLILIHRFLELPTKQIPHLHFLEQHQQVRYLLLTNLDQILSHRITQI